MVATNQIGRPICPHAPSRRGRQDYELPISTVC